MKFYFGTARTNGNSFSDCLCLIDMDSNYAELYEEWLRRWEKKKNREESRISLQYWFYASEL